jgi:hypothetical protein
MSVTLASVTGCFTKNVPCLWKTFLWLNYFDITEDTGIGISTGYENKGGMCFNEWERFISNIKYSLKRERIRNNVCDFNT